jgi:hypothetical protein
MTKEEKEIVLKALHRGANAGKGRQYLDGGRWKSVSRLVEKAIKIVERMQLEVGE